MVDVVKVDPICGEVFDGYTCTISQHHNGDHLALGSKNGSKKRICCKWKNKKDHSMSKQLKPYRYPLWLNILRFLTGQPWMKFKALPQPEEKKPQKLLPPKRDTTTSGPPPGCGDVFDRNGYMNADAIREAMSQVKQMQEILGQNVPSEAPKTNDILHLSYRPKGICVPSKDGPPDTTNMIMLDGDITTYLSEEVRKLELPQSMQPLASLAPPDPLIQLFQESVSAAEQDRLAKEKADEEYARSEKFKQEFKEAIGKMIGDAQNSTQLSVYSSFRMKEVVAKKVITWLNDNGVESRLCHSLGYAVAADRTQFMKLMEKNSSKDLAK
jgi:hypothetical protein